MTLHLPLIVQDRMAEAGRSLMRWSDEELVLQLDPRGRWRALSAAARWVGLGVTCAVFLGLGFWTGMATGVWVAIVLAGGIAASRGKGVPWQACAVLLATVGPHGWEGAVLLAGLAVWQLTLPRVRDGAFALLTVSALAAAHAGGWWVPPLLTVGVAAALWWQRMIAGHLPNPFVVVRPERVDQLPDAPSSIPWLVRHHPGAEAHEVEQSWDTRRKAVGAFGERITAYTLLGLPRGRGTRIAHDVHMPEAEDANVDHVVVHGGEVFVLDTKYFGSKREPGQVRWSLDGREPLHVTTSQQTSLVKSVNQLVRGSRRVGELMGVECTPIVVVHNAVVPFHGLRVTATTGESVDVISGQMLLGRLMAAPQQKSWWGAATRRWSLLRLRSAVTGRAPRVVSPLGPLTGRVKCQAWDPRQVELAPAARRPPAPAGAAGDGGIGGQGAPSPTGAGAASWPGRGGDVLPEQERGVVATQPIRTPPAAPAPRPAPEPSHEQSPAYPGMESFPPAQIVTTPSGQVVEAQEFLEAAPARAGMSAEEVLAEEMAAVWQHMRDSDPAHEVEVPLELRGIKAGVPVLVIEPGEDGEEEQVSSAVAVSGWCRSDAGPYLWVTSPSFWSVHERSGLPVKVVTRLAERIAVPPQVGGV